MVDVEKYGRRLNIGCGQNKIENFINIDCEQSVGPDICLDLTYQDLPYENNSVDEIVMFHTIEHIQKKFHKKILEEYWRVLKFETGSLLISFPEFRICFRNWADNYKGQKEFWEATMFGRQLYKSDFHVCAMDSIDFASVLNKIGFSNIFYVSEQYEDYNTVMSCVKNYKKIIKYPDLIKQDMQDIEIQ